MSTDLTVIVAAHDETAVCGPTMRAADLAVEAARERGSTIETIIGLDAPTQATSAYFQQAHFDHWERRVLQEGERGKVRALVSACDGRYIAFLSAGDLCSENWLAEGIAAMEAAGGRGGHVIAHPELDVIFDGEKLVHVNIDQDSPLFTPHYLCFRDYYDSSCIAPREAYLETPSVTQDIADGQPGQDVEFTVETMGMGWQHLVMKDTIVFKRRRGLSLVSESGSRTSIARALPALTIDRIRDLGSAQR